MKYLVCVLILVASAYAEVTQHWLEVPLDHFNLFDNRTWKMRYTINEAFFKPGKPLFLYIGGEAPIDPDDLQYDTQLTKLAVKHEGYLANPEHRFYGESLPFGLDFEIEDFKYLQIEQALEDLAYFIDHIKHSTAGLENSIVVAHGCSYPGMLATWIRLRFPHLVDISYASSAPLGVGLDYPEFYQVVYDAYANVSDACIQTIRRGFNQTQQLVKTRLGLKVVRDTLREWTCGNIDKMNSAQIMSKMETILNVMYDPVEYEILSCSKLAEDDLSSFHKLANFVVAKSKARPLCSEPEGEPDKKTLINSISWTYQTCTEMGTFQTLNRKDARNPFERDASLQESVDQCVEQFDGRVTEDVLKNGIERVTRRYGGKRPKVTKVVTVQGTNDPWKHLAVLEDYNSEAPVFVIKGSHCVDITITPDDPPELIEQRNKIRDVVSKWIEELS